MQPGGDPALFCFVDFKSPAHAATAKDALQGKMIIALLKLCSFLKILSFFALFANKTDVKS